MEQFYEKTEQRFISIFNIYAELLRKQYEYCPGVLLYPSEIHAIRCIASAGTINMTELSNLTGMTRGGVSKCIVKLEKMELVCRYKYIKNQKEIYLHLTEKGLEALQGHELYHVDMEKRVESFGRTLTDEQAERILNFLDVYLEEMESSRLKTSNSNK